MKRKLISLLAIVGLTGCTPAQLRAWVEWHNNDPDAAVEFANRPEVQADLMDDQSSDGPQFAQWLGDYEPGNCDSYVSLFEEFGLPVATFKRIAWRESGCNHRSFVSDRDDLGGGLLGINLKGYQQATRFNQWCGVTVANVTDAEKNVECASEAYQRMGMQPWG
jgi:hypothetical protein